MNTTEAKLARILIALGAGELGHLNRGQCPDSIIGHHRRDPECDACQALARAGKLARDAETVNPPWVCSGTIFIHRNANNQPESIVVDEWRGRVAILDQLVDPKTIGDVNLDGIPLEKWTLVDVFAEWDSGVMPGSYILSVTPK